MDFIGTASAITAAIGILGGGEVVDYGAQVGAQIRFGDGQPALVDVYASPIIHLGNLEAVKAGNWGLTIGTVTISNGRYSNDSNLMAYEREHVNGWTSKGLDYLGDVTGKPCMYDPLADWSINCKDKGLAPKDTSQGVNYGWVHFGNH